VFQLLSQIDVLNIRANVLGFLLKTKVSKCNNFSCLINLSYAFGQNLTRFMENGTIDPFQIKEEILQLIKILAKRQIRTALEIGTANGGTLFLFSHIFSQDALIASVDLPGGRFGGGYESWKTSFYKSFALPKQKLYLIRGDSHSDKTANIVKNIFHNKNLDFLFIDGDHAYEGAKSDFETYSKLVRPGGLIAFHDIVSGLPESVGGVPKFWNQIKNDFRHRKLSMIGIKAAMELGFSFPE